MDKKKKIFWAILILIFLFGAFQEFYKNYKLKTSIETKAKVLNVGDISSYTAIEYEYYVNNKKYTNSQSINRQHKRKLSNEQLEKIDDLKIKYSIDSPNISEIIDERIK